MTPQPHDPSAVEVPTPVLDLSIYVMPAFATLAVQNLERARRWYVEGLGFVVLAEVPGPTGDTVLVHLRRWRYQDLLLVPAQSMPERAGQGVRLTFWAEGADLVEVVTRTRALALGHIEGPQATPWNTWDVMARDPDGYEVVFTSSLPEPLHGAAFAQRMEVVKQRMLTQRAASET